VTAESDEFNKTVQTKCVKKKMDLKESVPVQNPGLKGAPVEYKINDIFLE